MEMNFAIRRQQSKRDMNSAIPDTLSRFDLQDIVREAKDYACINGKHLVPVTVDDFIATIM